MGVLLISIPFETTNPNAPSNPIKTPKNFPLCTGSLKIKMPKINVKKGVSEFNIPAKELVICVSANVNKKAGIPLPNTPTTVKYFHLSAATFLMCLNKKGSKNKNEIAILSAATSS